MEYDTTNYIIEYNNKLQSGEIAACAKIKQIYAKLAYDVNNPGKYHFDIRRAYRPLYFIETFCRQSKGEHGGELIHLSLYQKALIEAAYGFVDAAGVRQYRQVFVTMGRKNGKSTLLSGLCLYHMLGDGEAGPQVCCLGVKRDQAMIVFQECAHMVAQSPHLQELVKKRKTDLYSEANFGQVMPLASTSNSLDGLNCSFACCDEIAAWKDRNLYDVILQSQSARKQPLIFMITTAGFIRNSIYDSQYAYAVGVLSGAISDRRFLPILYELDDMKEWTDPAAWIKANPGLGKVKSREFLRESVEKAKADPAFKPTVLTKDFDAIAAEAAAYFPYEIVHNSLTFSMDELRGCYAICGVDLSATTDLSCATVLIKKPDSPTIYVLQQYYLPEFRVQEVEKMNSKEAPYRKWAEQGLLTICPGYVVDYKKITEWFMDLMNTYDITPWKIGVDRALANYFLQDLQEHGFETVKVAQGAYTFTYPMKELRAQLLAGNINYNLNSMLEWNLLNTAVREAGSADSIQPIKIRKNNRIDGTLSLLDAFTLYLKYAQDYENLNAE